MIDVNCVINEKKNCEVKGFNLEFNSEKIMVMYICEIVWG